MSGSSREAFPDFREWPGCPPGCPEVVRSPSLMPRSDLEALPDVREWSGIYAGCAGVVVESLRDVRDWSGD